MQRKQLARVLRVACALWLLIAAASCELELSDQLVPDEVVWCTHGAVHTVAQIRFVRERPQTQDGFGSNDRQPWHQCQLLTKLCSREPIYGNGHREPGNGHREPRPSATPSTRALSCSESFIWTGLGFVVR